MSGLRERVAVLSHAQRSRLAALLGAAADGRAGADRVVAYIVPRGATPDAAELRAFLKERLPEAMVPAAFVPLDHLPRTPSGKVDVGALPAPDERANGGGDPDAFVAPAGEVEQTLATIWSELLGGFRVGAHDNFFEIGGDSLLSIEAVARAKRAGLQLTAEMLFRHQTVAALAKAVASAGPLEQPLLVPYVPGDSESGTRPPFYFMHGLQGDVVVCYNLARHLARRQTVYGVRAGALEGRAADDLHIEAMAAVYAAEIRSLQPDGPYHLGGYCFGGALAYETARQLATDGHTVALLALIDADPRVPRFPVWTSILMAVWAVRSAQPGQRLSALRRKVGNALRRIGSTMRNAASPPAAADAVASAPDPFEAAHIAAYLRYEPEPFAGRVTLILASDDPPALARRRRESWAVLARGGVDVRTVPGTHYALMAEPHVRTVASRVQEALDAAASATPTATRPSD